MAELPVDPEKKHDNFYRYKMPPLATKIEGSGNGIKTVLPNIRDIATRINRDVEYPMKYFGNDLGAHSKNEDGKWIIMGQHSKERLQKSLYDYIGKFVLCKACRNPETRTLVDEKKNIILRCGACGKDTGVDVKEKLCNLIYKLEKVTNLQKEKEKQEKKKEKKEKKKEKKEDDGEEAAPRRGSKDFEGAGESQLNPVRVLKEFLDTQPTEGDIIIKVRDIKTDYALKDKDVARLLSEAVFGDGDASKKIRPYGGVFRKLVKEENQKYVVETLELRVHEERELVDKFPIMLKKLWDEDVVEEDYIIQWYEKEKKSKKLDADLCGEIKEKTRPLIEWLQQDEDDEDDD